MSSNPPPIPNHVQSRSIQYASYPPSLPPPQASSSHHPYPRPQSRSRRSESPARRPGPQQPARRPPPTTVEDWNAELDHNLAKKYLLFVHAQKKKAAALKSGTLPMKPRMEICDVPDSPVLTALFEIPGIRKDEITVTVTTDGRLTISGERRAPPLLNNDADPTLPRYPVRELKYGRFERTIDVPPGLEVNDITASLTDGMLSVSWPRTSPRQPMSRPDGSSTHMHSQMLDAQ